MSAPGTGRQTHPCRPCPLGTPARQRDSGAPQPIRLVLQLPAEGFQSHNLPLCCTGGSPGQEDTAGPCVLDPSCGWQAHPDRELGHPNACWAPAKPRATLELGLRWALPQHLSQLAAEPVPQPSL